MLNLAYLHIDELNKKHKQTLLNSKYNCIRSCAGESFELTIADNDRSRIQCVSIDTNSNINAFIEAFVSIYDYSIKNIVLISYLENMNISLIRDVLELFRIIFFDRRFRKVSFSISTKNPFWRSLQKYLKIYKIGQIIGIQKEHVKQKDGQYHDLVLVDIFQKDFCKFYKKKIENAKYFL